MKQFNNFKQLEVYLEKQVKIALDECAEQTLEKLKFHVENRLYDAWTPKQYERTMELLNCISKTSVAKVYGSYVCKIFYDTIKIHPYIRDGVWNSHSDIYGENTSEYIPLWIEYGVDGSLYDREGIYAIEDTFEWISREYNRMFKDSLKYKGISI